MTLILFGFVCLLGLLAWLSEQSSCSVWVQRRIVSRSFDRNGFELLCLAVGAGVGVSLIGWIWRV